MNGREKVFCIGLSKTGTTSLAEALALLGLLTRDNMGVNRYSPGDLSCVDLDEIDRNDAFTDTPIPSFYRELDIRYPGSRFILTIRQDGDWLRSCRKQFTATNARRQNRATQQVFRDLYDCVSFEESKFRDGYRRFVDGALAHFRERPEQLLVIDICGGEGWETLCPFLGLPAPKVPFPQTNVTAIEWIDIEAVVSIASIAGREIRDTYGGAACGGARATARRLMRSVRREIGRTVLGEGAEHLRRRARDGARQAILDGLSRLSPSTPVIAADTAAAAFRERERWSHFWLVEPFGNGPGWGEAESTVSIALIQGRKPWFGVVYFPFTDIVYYSRGARGSFRREGGEAPRALRLEAGTRSAGLEATLADDAETADRVARGICLVADGAHSVYFGRRPVHEWETAAAHAVLKFAGGGLYDAASNEEICYNNETLMHGAYIARAERKL